MLRVKTIVQPSPISGLGLFAAEPIKKGQQTWVFDDGLDIALPATILETLSELHRSFLLKYGFFSSDGATLFQCLDDLRFINHSQGPNIGSTLFEDIALRDIDAGEELTCDYRKFETDWFERRGIDPSTIR